MDAAEIAAAREKLKAKFGGSARIGGKGTIQRPKKAVHKSSGADDKKLQAVLKRLNVQPIPGIEEVTLTKDDGTLMVFREPKLQASLQANTFILSGQSETKQAGMDIEQLQAMARAAKVGGGPAPAADDDDDAMPELESGDDFETAAAK